MGAYLRGYYYRQAQSCVKGKLAGLGPENVCCMKQLIKFPEMGFLVKCAKNVYIFSKLFGQMQFTGNILKILPYFNVGSSNKIYPYFMFSYLFFQAF